MFIPGRTGTLYFNNEDVEAFVNIYAEAKLSLEMLETPHVESLVTPPTLLLDLAAYPSTATQRCWFLRPEEIEPSLMECLRSRSSFSTRREVTR